MENENYAIKLWNKKWLEFIEEQKFAILVGTNDVVVDFLLSSGFIEKRYGQLVFGKTNEVFTVCKMVGQRYTIMGGFPIPLEPDERLALYSIIEKFPFFKLDEHVELNGFTKELETALKFTKWDVESVKLSSYNSCRYGIEVMNSNGESLILYTKENRKRKLDEVISLRREIENLTRELDKKYSYYDNPEEDAPCYEMPVSIEDMEKITGLSKREMYKALRNKKLREKLYFEEGLHLLHRYGNEDLYKQHVLDTNDGFLGLFLPRGYDEYELNDYFVYKKSR